MVANSALSNSKKTVPVTADGDNKQEGGVTARKPPTHSPPSPLLGNSNKTEIPDRKRGNSITPNVSSPELLNTDDVYIIYISHFTFLGPVDFFFLLKECIPFILQACIKLIKSDSKDIYNITEYLYFFESSFH